MEIDSNLYNQNRDENNFNGEDFLLEDIKSDKGSFLYDMVMSMQISDSLTLYTILKLEVENFKVTNREEDLVRKKHMEDFIKIYELNQNVMKSIHEKLHIFENNEEEKFGFEDIPKQFTLDERKTMIESHVQSAESKHNMVQLRKGLNREQLKNIIQGERKNKNYVCVEAIYET